MNSIFIESLETSVNNDSFFQLKTDCSQVLGYLSQVQKKYKDQGKRQVRGNYLAELYTMTTYQNFGKLFRRSI